MQVYSSIKKDLTLNKDTQAKLPRSAKSRNAPAHFQLTTSSKGECKTGEGRSPQVVSVGSRRQCFLMSRFSRVLSLFLETDNAIRRRQRGKCWVRMRTHLCLVKSWRRWKSVPSREVLYGHPRGCYRKNLSQNGKASGLPSRGVVKL